MHRAAKLLLACDTLNIDVTAKNVCDIVHNFDVFFLKVSKGYSFFIIRSMLFVFPAGCNVFNR